jgi:hypothetical protein
VVVAYLERAARGVYASALRFPPVGFGSGCQAWSYLKRFGSSVAQPRPEAKYYGGRTEKDGGEPDPEVAERQGDDAARQHHYYPGHVVSGCQLGPQPTVAPTVSVLGEPLDLRWIIHPDRHLTACGAQTVLAGGGQGAFWHSLWRDAHMGPAGQVSCTPPGGWGSEASFPAHSPMMSRTRMIHPIPAHERTGFLGGRW